MSDVVWGLVALVSLVRERRLELGLAVHGVLEVPLGRERSGSKVGVGSCVNAVTSCNAATLAGEESTSEADEFNLFHSKFYITSRSRGSRPGRSVQCLSVTAVAS